MVEVVLKEEAILGEGVFWHPTEKRLYWVDILGKKIYCTDPKTGQNIIYNVPEFVGCIVPDKKGNIIMALENSISRLNIRTKEISLLSDLEKEIEGNRFNDGKCDPLGRFWMGSMCRNGVHNSGKLYCMDQQLNVTEKINNVTVSNGITWNSKKGKMYYIDSPTKQIVAFDYDLHSGDVTNKSVVVTFDKKEEFPDGMTIDTDGMLWVAVWGGGAVVRCNPNTGSFLEKIKVPAPHVTSCAFGGENLKTLFITTAREGLTTDQLNKFPLSGSLFKIDLELEGFEVGFFNIEK